MRRFLLLLVVFVAACSSSGRLAREGTTPAGETFREYSRIPYGYERILYSRHPAGSLRGDLIAVAGQMAHRLQTGRWSSALPSVIDAAERDKAIAELQTLQHKAATRLSLRVIRRSQDRSWEK